MSEPASQTDSSQAMPGSDFFLARQPILNRDQSLFAYELLFRNAATGAATVTDDLSATAAVIANLSELGVEQVIGGAYGFVNVDATVLMSDFVKFLPKGKVVLEILETVKATDPVLARVRDLAAVGFQFALDDVISDTEDVQKLLPLVGIVKVDIKDMTPANLDLLSGMLHRHRVKLLAEKVETHAEFQRCLELGFDYFQGYYFAKPVVLRGKKLAPSELAIMQLMVLLDSDADSAAIERCIKQDASISLNLLRLVNSPAVGARTRIESLGQAVVVLGRRQLTRWLQILLYSKPGQSARLVSPLLQLATTRGKLLELMAAKLKPGNRAVADIAFTVGIMSLMDTLFSLPMAEILDQMATAPEVRDALLLRRGQYGDMLKLAEYVERIEVAGPLLQPALRKLGLCTADLVELELAAFEWTNKISAGDAQEAESGAA